MLISDIYSQYSIPLNLQDHMLKVAAIGKLVVDNFNQDLIDPNLVVVTLLLHDMGNILKMDLSNVEFFYKQDQDNIDHYKAVKKDFLEKYGPDCDDATIQIIKEITSDKRAAILCATSHGEHSKQIAENKDWQRKIVYYCDMRVGPKGILSLENRFEDLSVRYKQNQKNIQKFHLICRQIEAQIQSQININLQTITPDDLSNQFNFLRKLDISPQ